MREADVYQTRAYNFACQSVASLVLRVAPRRDVFRLLYNKEREKNRHFESLYVHAVHE